MINEISKNVQTKNMKRKISNSNTMSENKIQHGKN